MASEGDAIERKLPRSTARCVIAWSAHNGNSGDGGSRGMMWGDGGWRAGWYCQVEDAGRSGVMSAADRGSADRGWTGEKAFR